MPDGWHLLGAGSMGSLAAARFLQAGWPLQQVGRHTHTLTRQLHWPDGQTRRLSLPADPDGPIERLIVATKATDTATALQPLLPRLQANSTLIRLQNGLGSLDDVPLPASIRVIEAVTTSGAWRDGERIHVVAENHTLFGDGSPQPPQWFTDLQQVWPDLRWAADIRHQQRLKLSVNAVINPLTALYDCENGRITTDPALREKATALADEVDRILLSLHPDWPADSAMRSLAVAGQTAANTSSMRADLRAGRTTEIEFINGWLLRQAKALKIPAPENQAVYQALLARHP